MTNARTKKSTGRKKDAIKIADSLVTTNSPPSKVKIVSILLAILVAISFCVIVWLIEGETILNNIRTAKTYQATQ